MLSAAPNLSSARVCSSRINCQSPLHTSLFLAHTDGGTELQLNMALTTKLPLKAHTRFVPLASASKPERPRAPDQRLMPHSRGPGHRNRERLQQQPPRKPSCSRRDAFASQKAWQRERSDAAPDLCGCHSSNWVAVLRCGSGCRVSCAC